MVAKTPPSKERRMAAVLNPATVRETLKKVDKCVARLQELQYAVSGGSKLVSGVNLSPRSTRGYLRTSLRCKQETLRIKSAMGPRSPVGKFPEKATGDWRRMSLPAMLLGETIAEILQASQMAGQVVSAAKRANITAPNTTAAAASADPRTPVALRRDRAANKAACEEVAALKARRTREKQLRRNGRSESGSPPLLRRARSRISFKAASPPGSRREAAAAPAAYRHVVAAQRVSPKHRPWAKKAVLFPNPAFSSPPSRRPKFCKTVSPVIAKANNNKQSTPPHRFLIKSPPSGPKVQVRIRGAAPAVSPSPPKRAAGPSRPKMAAMARLRRSLSPARLASRLVSPLRSRSTRRGETQNGRKINYTSINQSMVPARRRPL